MKWSSALFLPCETKKKIRIVGPMLLDILPDLPLFHQLLGKTVLSAANLLWEATFVIPQNGICIQILLYIYIKRNSHHNYFICVYFSALLVQLGSENKYSVSSTLQIKLYTAIRLEIVCDRCSVIQIIKFCR